MSCKQPTFSSWVSKFAYNFGKLSTFVPKSSHAQIFFFKFATQKGNDILLPKRQKKWGGHGLRFGGDMP